MPKSKTITLSLTRAQCWELVAALGALNMKVFDEVRDYMWMSDPRSEVDRGIQRMNRIDKLKDKITAKLEERV